METFIHIVGMWILVVLVIIALGVWQLRRGKHH